MRKKNTVLAPMLMIAAALVCIESKSAEIQIPRTMADKGKYYLLDASTKGGITTTLHKRVGVNETGYSKTEINCKTGQYRDIGYSEDGADKIKVIAGRWTDILNGSSKSDLVSFVCRSKS
jgi:ABC-type Na+ efflux pump permease subunit